MAIVTSTYCYKRPPKGRKAISLEVPASSAREPTEEAYGRAT
jgi:hypothetical protein